MARSDLQRVNGPPCIFVDSCVECHGVICLRQDQSGRS